MQISHVLASKSPSKPIEGLIGIIKHFKYELIKVIIFLFLFVASVFYVNSESKEYYNNTSVQNSDH